METGTIRNITFEESRDVIKKSHEIKTLIFYDRVKLDKHKYNVSFKYVNKEDFNKLNNYAKKEISTRATYLQS